MSRGDTCSLWESFARGLKHTDTLLSAWFRLRRTPRPAMQPHNTTSLPFSTSDSPTAQSVPPKLGPCQPVPGVIKQPSSFYTVLCHATADTHLELATHQSPSRLHQKSKHEQKNHPWPHFPVPTPAPAPGLAASSRHRLELQGLSRCCHSSSSRVVDGAAISGQPSEHRGLRRLLGLDSTLPIDFPRPAF